MAKLKMLKFPKKPKRTASVEQKQKFLAKVKAIDSENARRKKQNDLSDKLSQVISGIGSVKVFSSGYSAKNIRSRKSGKKRTSISGTRKKKATAKRKTSRRRR